MNFEMFAKLDKNGRIVYPPRNDGGKMNVHHNIEWLVEHGFEEHDQAWFDEHTPSPPEPPPQTVFTKLAIRRAMRSLGIEAKLDALLAASHTFAADWQDAQEIDLADPVLIEALAAGSITPEEIEAIREAVG